jgi:twinkle protein
MTGDITELKRKLADRAQSVAEYLLPGGKLEGGKEWRVGSVAGERGQSLAVHITGDKRGVWADFNGGFGGDLLDLWCAVRGVTLAKALEDARAWLGMTRPQPHREPRRTYQRPAKPACRMPQARVLDYLREDRAIPAEIITAYKVAEAGDDIVFPFLLPGGELALVKTRKAEDGAKPRPTAAGCEPVLFGWQAIPDNARDVVLTEGEIDALSMAAYGWPAMSVPFGGGGGAKQQWIENEFERMDQFERIFLATDMDKPGDEAAEAIADRLGRHRCARVKLPRKDANACLVEGVSKDEIDLAIRSAQSLDPDGLRRPSDFSDNVVELFWPTLGQRVGYSMPYPSMADRLLFRPAEITLWSGASGAGKSQILSDCVAEWISQGSRVCLASLEMKAPQTLKRLCKQVVSIDRPTEMAIRDSLVWLDQGLLLYDHVGKASVDALLEVFAYSKAKYGCDQFVIDSLMRLGIESDDYNGQEKAIYRIVDWTIANNVHCHLVAHARKGDRDRGVPETEDIKGAMEIGANAFNIITVFRNRKHEDEVRAAEKDGLHDVLAELQKKPGVIVNVAKQRNGDFEGKRGLWFDQSTYRYYDTPDRGIWDRKYIHQNIHPMEAAE